MGSIVKRFEDILCNGSLLQSLTVLSEAGVAEEIWRAGTQVGEVLLVHFVRFEDPIAWAKINDGSLASYVETLVQLRESLSCFPKTCKLLENMWSSRLDIAVRITSTTMQALAGRMAAVHPKFVAGCSKYLHCKLPQGWDAQLDQEAACQKVHSAVTMYIGAVTNLYLDAGHWHELWSAGKDVAICLIEHFLLHENQTGGKWSAEHVRNPEKYLNRNLQNIRDVVYANKHVVDVLSALKSARPDVALFLDGKALYRIASKLRTAEILLDFMAFLMHSLPNNWLESVGVPQAEVHTCIDIYISNGWHLTGQAMQSFHSRLAPGQIAAHPMHSPATSSAGSPRHPSLSCSPIMNADSPTFAATQLQPCASTFTAVQQYALPGQAASAPQVQDDSFYASFANMSLKAGQPVQLAFPGTAKLAAAVPSVPSQWCYNLAQ